VNWATEDGEPRRPPFPNVRLLPASLRFIIPTPPPLPLTPQSATPFPQARNVCRSASSNSQSKSPPNKSAYRRTRCEIIRNSSSTRALRHRHPAIPYPGESRPRLNKIFQVLAHSPGRINSLTHHGPRTYCTATLYLPPAEFSAEISTSKGILSPLTQRRPLYRKLQPII